MTWNQPQPPGYYPQQPKNSVLGIISIVFGAVAMLFAWIPLCGIISWPISIVGIILGVIGIILAGASQGRVGVGIPIGGTIMCIIALIIPFIWVIVIGNSAAPIPATQPATAPASTTTSG
jgi:hypothetical protein